MVKSLISGNMEENKILGEHSDLFQIIKDTMELKDIDIMNYSPLTLAYIGDGIYEIVIRTIIVDQANRQVNKIHKAASNLVKAHTQAEMIFAIMDKLTEQELAIYKRGRNAKAVTRAKNASMSDYRTATGFEALMGWLYLTNKSERMRYEEFTLEGRNAVIEAYRAGKTIDKLFVLEHCKEGSMNTVLREAKKHDTVINYVKKERLDQMSETGKHQGVIGYLAAYEYATVDEILDKAREKGESPFVILLDDIEDPHNLGAIIRTANLAGAHGVIIPKHRASGLTATVAKTSAGALNYTPVAKVTNISKTIEELKKEGMWFVCADMGGTTMYDLDLKGSIGLVIGNEGKGVSRLVKEKCDFVASIPMFGDIDSLNASVATGVLAYEIVRQRMGK